MAFERDNDEGPTQPQPPMWREPTLRTWVVRRANFDSGDLEEIRVDAHGITHGNNGEIIFQRFFIDPAIGPNPVPVRSFASYYDYEDVTPPTPQPSVIVH